MLSDGCGAAAGRLIYVNRNKIVSWKQQSLSATEMGKPNEYYKLCVRAYVRTSAWACVRNINPAVGMNNKHRSS